MKRIAVHGGVRLLGDTTEVVNLDLEQLSEDPIAPSPGSIWSNTTIKRVGYTEGEGVEAVNRYIAHGGDIALLVSALALKANADDVTAQAHANVRNVSNHDMLLGQPVYGPGESTIDLASADNDTKKNVIGLVSDEVILSQTGMGRIQSANTLAGTVAQWEAVTGMIGGLVPNMKYFLDSTSGKMTIAPPTDAGKFNCLLGVALSSTVFMIRIERPISL